MTRDEFEREFHSRTLTYLPSYRARARQVAVLVGDDAHTPAGHALVVALVAQLARAHHCLSFHGLDDRPLLCQPLLGASTLVEATEGLAKRINPFIEVTQTERRGGDITSIAVGRSVRSADLHVGCSEWCAVLGPEARIDSSQTGLLGAMLASCLGAAFAFHRVLGLAPVPEGRFSLWDFGSPETARGPRFEQPLELGSVLQAGAGGVGASLDFWLALLGIRGHWTIVDGDRVEVSNLNRQLAFTASDAGFPHPPARAKANAAAALLGPAARPVPRWYGEDLPTTNASYDVILALANDHGVRAALQARQPPVLLHATTSPNWEAQFHRHIAGHDDCISCRIPPSGRLFACAEASLDGAHHVDAALPFLSATAGVLLLAGLIKLQLGALLDSPRNFAALNLGEPMPVSQRVQRVCTAGCPGWAPLPLRRAIAAESRFAHLDPARTG